MKFGNTKTHFCIGIAAAVLVMLLLTVGAFAAEEHGGVVDSGKCGENLTWMLYKDGLLQISGTGKMDNYDSAFGYMPTNTTYAPWHFYRGQINRVNLGSGITTIGDCAFHDCTGFTGSLTIPNSVTSIGSSAFSGCTGFTGSLTIPDSVTSIGGYAFSDCSGLKALTIPNSVTSIGESAFSGCSGLTTLTFHDSVESIGNSAFSGCSSLESATFRGNAPTVGNDIFKNCADGFTVYCYKKYATSFITYGGKWNGYPLVVLDDTEPTPEVGLRLTGAVLDVGSTIRFSASVPAGDTILWSSTDSNVASVENGTVTARSEGTTVIIATAKNGRTSVSFDVTVNPAPEPVIKGDFDGDGHVTAKDRMILSRYLAGWPAYTKYFEQ